MVPHLLLLLETQAGRNTLQHIRLLAIYLAIRHFCHMVEGRQFAVFTDHKPLTRALTSRSEQHSPRQVRHLDFVSQFTSDIRHVQGAANPVADELSRIELNTLQFDHGIDFEEMVKAQPNDPDLTAPLPSSSSLDLHTIPIPASLLCDLSTGVPRLFVPQAFRRKVFDSLHSLSHPGVCATERLLTTRYVCPTSEQTCESGRDHASLASEPRCTNILSPHGST